GSDYFSTNGTLTFMPGQTNQPISITVLGDALNEREESIFVNLGEATNATIAWPQGIVHIIDSPPPDCELEVYQNDFEGAVGPEWSNNRTETTPLGARRFLGQFANGTVSLSLTNLPEHTAITASFDLFIIRSWDGNQPIDGEEWDLSVGGGPTLLHTTFCNLDILSGIQPGPLTPTRMQAYPSWYPGPDNAPRTGATETNTLGYFFSGFVMDSVYRLNFTFPHTD